MTGQQSGARVELRANMFVLATISSGSASGPVKIRNMSPSGALIEGAALPSVGARVELRRGGSSMGGAVVWSLDGKAGLRFDGRVDVAEWMPGGHVGQQRVDSVIEQLKSGAARMPAPEDKSLLRSNKPAAADLRQLARALDSLADDLADDFSVVNRLGAKLQALDIASQVLRKLAASDAGANAVSP